MFLRKLAPCLAAVQVATMVQSSVDLLSTANMSVDSFDGEMWAQQPEMVKAMLAPGREKEN